MVRRCHGRLACVLHVVAVLVWTLLAAACVSAQPGTASSQDLTIVSVSGDGSCINEGGVALNCTMPFVLTVNVVSLTLPLDPYSLYLYATAPGWRGPPIWYDPSLGNATLTSVEFLMALDVYSLRTGALLNITLSQLRGGSSRSNAGFSLVSFPLPLITAVSGCQPTSDPLTTINCYADVDVLTLTGQGFDAMDVFTLHFTAAGKTLGAVYYSVITTGDNAVVLNDSVMTMTLDDRFGWLLWAEHYSAVIISLWMSWDNGYSSNVFNVSMAAVPAPVVSGWSVSGAPAVVTANITTFPDCIPGVNRLWVAGKWLYSVNLTVGETSCAVTPNQQATQATSASCLLPVIPSDVPGTLYTVTVQNSLGQVTLPPIVGYTSSPSIASASVCWSDGGFSRTSLTLRCAAGETLTIAGNRFATLQSGAVSNVTLTSTTSSAFLSCLNVTVVSNTTLTCLLPNTTNEAFIMRALNIAVGWNSGFVTNALRAYVYDYLNPPRILALTGCDSWSDLTTGLALTGCQPGAVITLSGALLNVSGGAMVRSILQPSNWYCAPLDVLSNSSVVCQLPTLSEFGLLQYAVQYSALLLPIQSGGIPLFVSNAFFITFAWPASSSTGLPAATYDSSSTSTTTIVASVAAVATLLLGIAVCCWYRRRSKCVRDQSGSSEQSGAGAWVRMGGSSGSPEEVEVSGTELAPSAGGVAL